MVSTQTKRLVFTAMLTALTCVATMVIQIPSGTTGYKNLGDCFVLLSGWLLGPIYGTLAGGIGSAMADLLTGYYHYIPGTLIVKGASAFVAAILYRLLKRILNDKYNFPTMLISGIPAEMVMVCGYFLYAGLILGKGLMGEAGAIMSVPGNLIQGTMGIIAAIAVMAVLRASGVIHVFNCFGINEHFSVKKESNNH